MGYHIKKHGRSRLTDELRARVIAAYRSGLSAATVARKAGCSTAAVYTILVKSKVRRRRRYINRRRHIPPDDITKAVGLYESGLSLIRTAMQIGASPAATRDAMRRRGVEIRLPAVARILHWGGVGTDGLRRDRVHREAVAAYSNEQQAAGNCRCCGKARGRSRHLCDRCLKRTNKVAMLRNRRRRVEAAAAKFQRLLAELRGGVVT